MKTEICKDCGTKIHDNGCDCDWTMIIHDKCGLDVSLCICPDSKIKIIEEKGGDSECI